MSTDPAPQTPDVGTLLADVFRWHPAGVAVLTRRLVTLIPALILLATPISPTWALVLSQVLLSMGLPFAITPLTRLTNDRELMGRFVNGAPMKVISWTVTGLITVLNVVLIWLTLTGAD